MANNAVQEVIADVFKEMAQAIETDAIGEKIRVGLTILGSEHDPAELVQGAELAQQKYPDLQVTVIGSGVSTQLEAVAAEDESEAQTIMDELLLNHTLDAAVTMHYSFPIGVSTIGRIFTPVKGREMLMASTTGTSSTDRVTAMLRNTLGGIAVAKACGNANPSIGILNVDGARQVERSLLKLKDGGYPINLAESVRVDGGVVMRGNDLLMGIPDVMVQDSLTGNVLVKVLSAYSSGGNYETMGYGYGPGVGEDFDRIVCIVSRASGTPVITGAIRFAADCVQGNLLAKIKEEYRVARKAGWEDIINTLRAATDKQIQEKREVSSIPEKKPVTDTIAGVDVMQLEEAVHELWEAGLYAECGMGCTGPVIMVAPEDKERASEVLKKKEFL